MLASIAIEEEEEKRQLFRQDATAPEIHNIDQMVTGGPEEEDGQDHTLLPPSSMSAGAAEEAADARSIISDSNKAEYTPRRRPWWRPRQAPYLSLLLFGACYLGGRQLVLRCVSYYVNCMKRTWLDEIRSYGFL